MAIRAAGGLNTPCYIRFGKAAMYDLHPANTKFGIGKAIQLRDGKDVAFIATGETVVHCLLAAGALPERGFSSRVLSLHTINPLGTEAVLRAGRECRAVLT